MSTSQQPAPPSLSSNKPAKPRSPVERAIVWGGIVVLLILVGLEYNWKRAHAAALKSLLDKVAAEETTNEPVKVADVKAIVGGRVPRKEGVKGLASNASRVEIYSWPSINPFRKRELYVYYGIGSEEESEVISVTDGEDLETADRLYAPPTQEEAAALMKKAYIRPQKEQQQPAAGNEADSPPLGKPADEKPADAASSADSSEKGEK